MSFILDFLKLRRPILDYVSPPVCEVIFSSTGVVIILDPLNAPGSPSGLGLGGDGGGRLIWDNFPDAICYNIYKAVDANDPNTAYTLVLECIPGPDIPVPDPPTGCFRVSAITPNGESNLSDPFCITDNFPSVITDPATDIQSTSAILNGQVNPHGVSSSVFFQWGETVAYGDTTPAFAAGAGSIFVPFDDLVESLSQNTTYHFRAVATNGAVTIFGEDRQFTTLGGGGEDDCNDNGHGEHRVNIVTSEFGAWHPETQLALPGATEWDGCFRFQIPPNDPNLGGFCVLGVEGNYSIQGYRMDAAYFYFWIPSNSWYFEIWNGTPGFSALIYKAWNLSPIDTANPFVRHPPQEPYLAGSPPSINITWGTPP